MILSHKPHVPNVHREVRKSNTKKATVAIDDTAAHLRNRCYTPRNGVHAIRKSMPSVFPHSQMDAGCVLAL